MLVVPRKHVSTIYELSAAEQKQLWGLVSQVRSRLLTGLAPHAFSIGFNDTMHLEVTANHAAVHIVPRWHGDNLALHADLDWVTDDSSPSAIR